MGPCIVSPVDRGDNVVKLIAVVVMLAMHVEHVPDGAVGEIVPGELGDTGCPEEDEAR